MDYYNEGILSWAKGIYSELARPENGDLNKAVAEFDGEGGFMFGFRDKRDFDKPNHLFPLTTEQNARWDAIADKHDPGGGTGAMFGMASRLVQAWLTGVREYGT